MTTIEGKANGKIDVKRLYIPGIKIKDLCPVCGSQKIMDLEDFYLSYPVMGKPYKLRFYCEEEAEGEEDKTYCDTEWSVTVIPNITLEIV